jgi:hypothetical protein
MLAPFLAAILLAGATAPQQESKLAIVDPALRQYEDGPPLAGNFSFVTGEMVFVSFRIDGYKVSPEAQAALRAEVDALDPQGVKLVETMRNEIKTAVSVQDKDWAPIVRQSFLIPPLALPGIYHVRIAVDDELAGKQVKTAIDFKVRGHEVQPSDTLVARNFRFLTSEDGQQVIEPAVFQPGGMLWARFDMTGFRYGDNNRVAVEYGFSVLSADGKELYSQPNAATGEGESFYPRKYMEGVLSLDLKTARPGDYIIVLKLHDLVGNQIAESRHPFSIRP